MALSLMPLKTHYVEELMHVTPHGQPLLSHYPHFSAANRKTLSLQKSFELSRSKPRSPTNWSTAARPIAMFHTSSMKSKRKAMSPSRLFARYGIKGSLKPRCPHKYL
ncbi:hypothetical protein TNCV_3267421 [Trichonephila clavipes]|nr:hypothetical protein TNCV_3267421 [Trichonephila clavipes]